MDKVAENNLAMATWSACSQFRSTKPVHEHEDDYFGDVNNNDDSDDGDKNHNDDDDHDENDNDDTNTNPDHSAFYTTPSPARYSSSIAEVTIKGFL